jgi:hypothetical protein
MKVTSRAAARSAPHERHRPRRASAIRWIVLVGLAAVCTSSVTAAPSQPIARPAPPDVTPPPPSMPITPSGEYTRYPGGGVTTLGVGPIISAGGCSYQQANDTPHISSTTPRAVSVHGWFVRTGGTCPKANVDIYLQAYRCDVTICGWVTVANDSRDVFAGGGSANRVTGRRVCSSSGKVVSWRGLTDVDLIGISDPSGFQPSPIANITCVP